MWEKEDKKDQQNNYITGRYIYCKITYMNNKK